VLLRPILPEEQAEMDRLCRLIQDEKDHKKFSDLIDQLTLLFKRREHCLNGGLRPTDKPPA
jgi:hypothetical protein